ARVAHLQHRRRRARRRPHRAPARHAPRRPREHQRAPSPTVSRARSGALINAAAMPLATDRRATTFSHPPQPQLHAPEAEVLFAFGDISFPSYFTMLTLGFGLALILTVRESTRLGMDRERVLDTNLWMVVWGIIGARVLHLIADGHFHDYVNLCTNPKLVPPI